MLDSQLNIDGLFTYLLYTAVVSEDIGRPQYKFRTNTLDGTDTCKSPLCCFEDLYIDNNLQFVLDTIDKYNLG